jgi:uncharacterized protein
MTQFAKFAFTDNVKALQERYRSRASYARLEASDPDDASLGADEITFLENRDSFFWATINSDGWPYIQHRGGPRGFLHVLDPRTLGFADYLGNKQYITLGNLQTNDRVAMIFVDYPTGDRLKILGHARAVDVEAEPTIAARLQPPADYRARVERLFIVEIVAWDWNCNQHITPRYTIDELRAIEEDAAEQSGTAYGR